uniref:B-cell receptor CD22-like n=1 Tax=Scatophagus argus TaxID=75038 RepID=UPI001ED865BB|nr:B-cell receptor CD22-like [Scatophagus argus]
MQGPKGIYPFKSIRLEDNGIYYCKSQNQYGLVNSTSVHINIQYGPKLPSVSVSPSAEIVEGSSVTLSCSSDANPAANFTWYKENEDSPKASGQNFTITDFRAEHSGNYYCEAQNLIGSHRNTLHLTVVASLMKVAAAGSITAILLVIIVLSVFLFIRKKRSAKQTTERPDHRTQVNMGSVCDNTSAALESQPAEERDDLWYASVRFHKNQEDALYSNITPVQRNRQKNEEEEEDSDCVEYSAVNFNNASAPQVLTCPEDAAQDPSALYSTIPKKPA